MARNTYNGDDANKAPSKRLKNTMGAGKAPSKELKNTVGSGKSSKPPVKSKTKKKGTGKGKAAAVGTAAGVLIAKKIISRTLISILIICLLVGSVVLGAVVGFVDNSMDLIAEEYNLDFTSIIYFVDSNGNPVELDRVHRTENREWIDIEKLPENLPNAFIAIEDERFREHSGVDIKRTVGAFGQWVMGRDSYGGSTITQQLIKNITGDNDRSPTRKIQEIIRAMNLEKKMSKDQIIEMYMNTIYFGEGCHGVQTAAKHYFSKSASDLTLEECASLAAIVKAPTTYNPATNYENNKERRNVILNKMAELKLISVQERDEAKQRETVIKIGENNPDLVKSEDIKSYFVDALVEDVIHDLMVKENLSEGEATNRLYTGGFKIYSTYDPIVQDAIDKVYTDISRFTNDPNKGQLQSAIMVMDPYTGHIKGMAGGVGKKTVPKSLNRATQTSRQPGSSFKPVAVYAPALEQGVIHAGSVVNNKTRTFGKDYNPKNSSKNAPASASIRTAIKWSYNVAAVEVMEDLTPQKSYDFLSQKLGFTTLVDSETRNGKVVSDKNLSMALGGLTDGVTIEEMTAAYCTFANKGMYNKPVTYTKVIDSSGKIILENKPQNKRAMSEETAYIMTDMMSGVVTGGTGKSAKIPDVFTAGKTGTSNDNKDKWFMGITPNYVTGVWTGYDIPADIVKDRDKSLSMTLYKEIMTEIHSKVNEKSITVPEGLVKRTVCQVSGNIASTSCYSTTTEYFKDGTQPTVRCTSHSRRDDDTEELPPVGGDGGEPEDSGEGDEGGEIDNGPEIDVSPGNPAA